MLYAFVKQVSMAYSALLSSADESQMMHYMYPRGAARRAQMLRYICKSLRLVTCMAGAGRGRQAGLASRAQAFDLAAEDVEPHPQRHGGRSPLVPAGPELLAGCRVPLEEALYWWNCLPYEAGAGGCTRGLVRDVPPKLLARVFDQPTSET